VTLLVGLRAALAMLREEGIDAVWARHARHAEAVRAAAEALDLSLFAERPSNAITAIRLPDGLDGVALVATMRSRYGVLVGGGLAHLRGRIIRISNLGYVDDVDILSVVSALEMGLAEMEWPFERGAGVAAAERALIS
jgi:aspartate aminotransferase-like enzyme